MAYRATDSSSTQSPAERAAEARRIIFDMGLARHVYEMTSNARNMVESKRAMLESNEDAGVVVTVKELWWLRDLRERYCE